MALVVLDGSTLIDKPRQFQLLQHTQAVELDPTAAGFREVQDGRNPRVLRVQHRFENALQNPVPFELLIRAAAVEFRVPPIQDPRRRVIDYVIPRAVTWPLWEGDQDQECRQSIVGLLRKSNGTNTRGVCHPRARRIQPAHKLVGGFRRADGVSIRVAHPVDLVSHRCVHPLLRGFLRSLSPHRRLCSLTFGRTLGPAAHRSTAFSGTS